MTRTFGRVHFPGSPVHGLRVAYLGLAGGWPWVEALESKGEVQAGEEFVWLEPVERDGSVAQLDLFA